MGLVERVGGQVLTYTPINVRPGYSTLIMICDPLSSFTSFPVEVSTELLSSCRFLIPMTPVECGPSIFPPPGCCAACGPRPEPGAAVEPLPAFRLLPPATPVSGPEPALGLGPTACTMPLIGMSFPPDNSILSKTIPSDASESPLERAFAAVTWPTTFDPTGITTPLPLRSAATVVVEISSPAFNFLESMDFVRVTGMTPCTALASLALLSDCVAAAL